MAQRLDPGTDPSEMTPQERLQQEKLMGAMAALESVFPGAALCLFVFNALDGESHASYAGNADPSLSPALLKAWVARREGDAG